MDQDFALNSFLLRYLADAEAGARRLPEEYARLYPGHEDLIAGEYARLQSSGPAGTEARIGRYRLERELGRGGQGVVHLAVDTQLNRHVALKVLTGVSVFSDDVLKRFRREAEVASRVDHPGICAVFDAGEHDRIPYIAMRYVEGETLAIRVARARESGKSPAVKTMVELIEKAARALHAAHEAGVLHRDIKPGNIMLTRQDDPVILDFGLARALDGDAHVLTQTGDFFGTPSYMSPEQVSGGPLDARTDVYSLGATLYEAVTLRRPFEEPTREKLYHAICTRRPGDPTRFNPAVRGDLCIVLECALESDRNRRYQSALDFAEDLRRIRMVEPIRARPVGSVVRLARWARRNRGLALALSALFVLLVTALVGTLVLLHDTRTERDDKDAALALVERLSDVKRLEDLQGEAERLWPAVPATAPAMTAWLRRASALEQNLPGHKSALALLRARGRQEGEGAGTRWVLPSTEQQWHHDTLAKLVDDVERFVSPDPASGLTAAMRARLVFAQTVERRTLIEPAEAWRGTIAAIADVAGCPQYRGLRIKPQLGLVPIGRDPESGQFEFVHLQSGAAPVRDPAGRLTVGGETGVVLVLLPGGTFEMGAATPVSAGSVKFSNIDPNARSDEFPPHEVTLGPFFMSKYEMTQGQWLRVTGTNPSAPAQSSAHPLNFATYEECERTLHRIGLEPPTEAQWEYAARAGTHTPWWTGAETRSIGGAGNVADRATAAGGPPSWHYEEWLDDGHGGPAPVGSFRPNPFGIHDVIGNVWEWCRDRCQDYGVKPEGDAALRIGPGSDSGSRIARGGSYIYAAVDARSSRRSQGLLTGRSIYNGVRPARPIRDE